LDARLGIRLSPDSPHTFARIHINTEKHSNKYYKCPHTSNVKMGQKERKKKKGFYECERDKRKWAFLC
jgi:hypothetical protein